jgi:parallel beta-helix repeat protein
MIYKLNSSSNPIYSILGLIFFSVIVITGGIIRADAASLDNNANLFWVRTDGNDGCTGQQNLSYYENNIDCAWRTVQKAASSLNAGQTASIQSGIYNENNIQFTNAGSSGFPIVIQGDGLPYINGIDTIFYITKNYINITGLNITSISTKIDGIQNDIIIPAIKITSNNNIIFNNIISVSTVTGQKSSNPENGGATPGIFMLNSNYNSILNNTIASHNMNSPSIQIQTSTQNIIKNNILDSRNFYEIYFGDYQNWETTNTVYFNHTIKNNTAYQGKPIYYYYNEQDKVYDYSGTNIGLIYVAYSHNMSFSNIYNTNNNGIVFFHVDNSVINNFKLTQTTGNGIKYGAPKYAHNPSIVFLYSNYNNLYNILITSGGRHNNGFECPFSCNYNNITNYSFNAIWLSDSSSHDSAIELNYDSTHNKFTNLTLSDGVYSSYPITLYSNSDYNIFINVYSYRGGVGGTDLGWIIRSNNNYFENITSIVAGLDYCGLLVSGIGNKFYNGNLIFNSCTVNYGVASYQAEMTGANLINDKGGENLAALLSNQIFYRGYYLDVNVTYPNGIPVNNAIVAITNEVNASAKSKDYNLIDKSTFNTDASGHTKLPGTSNASTSPILMSYRRNNAWENYSYTISASDGTHTSYVSGITPNLTWYRPNPSVPTYTVNIVLSSGPLLDGDNSLFWVRTDGSDSCNGQNNLAYSQDSTVCAWRTIQKAASTLTAGQTVRVQAGNYGNEKITIGNSGTQAAPITFKADGEVILESNYTGAAFSMTNIPYITIQGFTIRKYVSGIWYESCNGVRILNNIISESYNSIGITNRYSSYTFIENNTVSNSGLYNMYLYKSNNITLKNNLVFNNWSIANNDPALTSDYGFKLDYIIDSYSENNLAYNSEWHGWRLRHSVINNTFKSDKSYNNGGYGFEMNDNVDNNTFIDIIDDGNNPNYPSHKSLVAGGRGVAIYDKSENNTFINATIRNEDKGFDIRAAWYDEGMWGYNVCTDDNTGAYIGGYCNYESRNNKIINSTIENVNYGFRMYSPGNIMEGNKITGAKIYDYFIEIGPDSEIIDPLNSNFTVKLGNSSSSLNVWSRNNMVFNHNSNEPITYEATKSVSRFTGITNTIKINTYPISAIPASNNAIVVVNYFDTSRSKGEILVNFTANTINGNNVIFKIGGLKSGYGYLIKRDTVALISKNADSAGFVEFSNSDWSPSTRTFTLEESSGVTSNIVGLWAFDEAAGNIAHDSSGNGNNGTLYGATWATGKLGNALNFDGVASYVNIPYSSNLDITNNITVVAWVKGAPQTYKFIVDKYDNGANKRSWKIGTNSTDGDKLEVIITDDGFGNPGHSKDYISSVAMLDNTWKHVAFTFNNGALSLYINGIKDTNVNKLFDDPIISIFSSNVNVSFGSRFSNNVPSNFFNGTIDDVKIYNGALSAEEIKAVYESNGGYAIEDIDQNGVINQADLDIITYSILFYIPCTRCDVNKNGVVDVYDVVLVSTKVTG